MRHIGRTHRTSVAWMHEVFSAPNINLVYEATHRQCADIYTKSFHEPGKWYPVCLLVNVVDRHKFEKEQEDILADFKELKPEKRRTPHDLYEYTAAPSVQRRGGYHKRRCNDDCDSYTLRFNDFPLHDSGGEFEPTTHDAKRQTRVRLCRPGCPTHDAKRQTWVRLCRPGCRGSGGRWPPKHGSAG